MGRAGGRAFPRACRAVPTAEGRDCFSGIADRIANLEETWMRSPMLGEFMGTMMMILLGDGVVAAVLLKRSKAENSGWMVIATGWAFAVLCGIFTAVLCGSQDAHLNPAITLAMAVQSGDFSKLAIYLPAQMLGAFVGATLVWLQYFPHWKITEDP